MVDSLLHQQMLEGRAAMLAHDVAGSRQRQAERRGQIRCGDGPVVVERDELVDAVRERVAAARDGAEVGGGDDEAGREDRQQQFDRPKRGLVERRPPDAGEDGHDLDAGAVGRRDDLRQAARTDLSEAARPLRGDLRVHLRVAPLNADVADFQSAFSGECLAVRMALRIDQRSVVDDKHVHAVVQRQRASGLAFKRLQRRLEIVHGGVGSA